MSDQGIDAAVEKILADPRYARQVYDNAEEALKQFPLEPGEWRSIAYCLKKDVEDSIGDVRGHAAGSPTLGGVNFRRITAVPRIKGQFDRKAFAGTVWE